MSAPFELAPPIKAERYVPEEPWETPPEDQFEDVSTSQNEPKVEQPQKETTAVNMPVDNATNSSQPTLQGEAAPNATDVDIEKQPAKPQMPTFPEGGLWGWLAVLGAWLSIFTTFGMANTFGVFQSYYQFVGYPNESASNISWIGSLQLFFQFALGAVSGPLYDKGYFRELIIVGSVIYVVCFFMVSLAHEFWQVVLAQAIGCGIGIGLLFLPFLSVISQYFFKRRALAIGIVTTGSSLGGICLPIMLNNLIESHGFPKAVQFTGYLILGCLIIAIAITRTRLPPNKKGKAPSPKELFASRAYVFAVAGLFFVAWGLFFPIFYIQVFGELAGIRQSLTFYTLAILNAASVIGRITPNFIADYFGSINLCFLMCGCAGAIVFGMFGVGTAGGLIVVTLLYGLFSGAFVSLMSPAVISLANNHQEIGIRLGMAMLIMSFAALSGTPITGQLLETYGKTAPIVFSGVSVLLGSFLLFISSRIRAKEKGTWKV